MASKGKARSDRANAKHAYRYLKNTLKRRDTLAEEFIKKDAEMSVEYAMCMLLKGVGLKAKQ